MLGSRPVLMVPGFFSVVAGDAWRLGSLRQMGRLERFAAR